jgi:hypothetical protein
VSDHIFARNPSLVAGAVQVFQKEIEDGLAPEAAMLVVLDRVLPLHARDLAEQQRRAADAWAADGYVAEADGLRKGADLLARKRRGPPPGE